MPRPVLVSFQAGNTGAWRIERVERVVGAPLASTPRLEVVEGTHPANESAWTLTGFTSNERYVERPEREALTAVQETLGRPETTCAALIPIRKVRRMVRSSSR